MPYCKIDAVGSEIQIKHVNQLCGQKLLYESYKILSTALYGAETWTLRQTDQKYLGSFRVRGRRRMEKTVWTVRVKNEEVLHRIKDERKVLTYLLTYLLRRAESFLRS